MLDPRWNLVDRIETFADSHVDPSVEMGYVRARQHATGWFLSAHPGPDLTAEQRRDFAEFAKVRCYLLLTQGPTVATWTPGDGDDDWFARATVDGADLTELLPDVVPAHWR